MTSIKGLGLIAFKEIINNRPFKNIEELLFNENIKYNKLNKKSLDVLCRSNALSCLTDQRFSGTKHFWSVVAVDRPKVLTKFLENIEKYKSEGDFSENELIENLISLTRLFSF